RAARNVAPTLRPEVETQRVGPCLDRGLRLFKAAHAADFNLHSAHDETPASASRISRRSAAPGSVARIKHSPTRNALNPADFSLRISVPEFIPLSLTSVELWGAREASRIDVSISTAKVVRSRL